MWLRAVTVSVSSDDNSCNMIFGYQNNVGAVTHRIDFEYTSSIGWGSDYGTITLFNLSPSEQGSLIRNDKILNIRLQAGYLDDGMIRKGYGISANEVTTPDVFIGSITNVVTFKSGTEDITQLYCVPASSLSVTRLCGIDSISKGTTLKTALTQITSGCGLGVRFTGIPDTLLSRPFKRGRAFSKTYRDELKSICEENNLSFMLSPVYVEFFPAAMSNDSIGRMMEDTGVIEILPDNVIGNGVSGIRTLELSLNLNACIMPGMLIDVTMLQYSADKDNPNNTYTGYLSFNQQYEAQLNFSSIVIAGYSVYQIKNLVHHGSTHSDTFQTDISAVVTPDSLMGSKDHEWREWGTKVMTAN